MKPIVKATARLCTRHTWGTRQILTHRNQSRVCKVPGFPWRNQCHFNITVNKMVFFFHPFTAHQMIYGNQMVTWKADWDIPSNASWLLQRPHPNQHSTLTPTNNAFYQKQTFLHFIISTIWLFVFYDAEMCCLCNVCLWKKKNSFAIFYLHLLKLLCISFGSIINSLKWNF